MHIPSLTHLVQQEALTLFWFRRDLRIEDNHGMYQALKTNHSVLSLFIFDTIILSKVKKQTDKRVQFIYEQVQQLKNTLEQSGSTLLVCYGEPVAIFKQLARSLHLKAVYTNQDYEPYARQRDQAVATCLAAYRTGFYAFKDQVIFEKDEIVKEEGAPYTVFTPYMKKWKSFFNPSMTQSFGSSVMLQHCLPTHSLPLISLQEMGFKAQNADFPSNRIDLERIKKYDQQRDIPSVAGTSQLSVHFRFGTISIRHAVRIATVYNEVWLNELIWREFYMMILWHFPHVTMRAFKPIYDQVAWENNETHFQAWCAGQTGYPMVDAGMRELNATGYMHNRLRMLTASFLTKHLLIDWRWGEAYFAAELLDFELSSNNGGWQWAAGSGCDAAPYFRIFNPHLQAKKFDPTNIYVKRWVPEVASTTYAKPIVVHHTARERALAAYKKALTREV